MGLSSILQIPASAISPGLEQAAEIVDRIHRCPPLPRVPVIINRSRTEEGAYYRSTRPERPLKIAISIFAVHPELTLLHEIGHLLDHMALSPLKRGFASEFDFNF